MLKQIISAIMRALRSVGRVAGRIASAPFVALGSMFGGGGGDMPMAPEVQPYAGDVDEPATGSDMDVVYRELANCVMAWAAESIVAGQPVPLPPKMPRSISAWLIGITLDEAHAILNATESEVSAHLWSRVLINGVSSVRPLDAVVWPEEPQLAIDEGSPGFLLSASGYAPAR